MPTVKYVHYLFMYQMIINMQIRKILKIIERLYVLQINKIAFLRFVRPDGLHICQLTKNVSNKRKLKETSS